MIFDHNGRVIKIEEPRQPANDLLESGHIYLKNPKTKQQWQAYLRLINLQLDAVAKVRKSR